MLQPLVISFNAAVISSDEYFLYFLFFLLKSSPKHLLSEEIACSSSGSVPESREWQVNKLNVDKSQFHLDQQVLKSIFPVLV